MIRASLFALAVATLLAACSDGASFRVRAVTDLVPGPEFASVRVDLVVDESGAASAHTLPGGFQTTTIFGQDFSRGRDVAEFEDLSDGTYTVRVQLFRPDETLLGQKRQRVVIAGNTVTTVHLTRDCVDVMCPSPGGSPAFSECLAGRCVSPECLPPATSDACNEIVFCNSETDCPDTAMCATRGCVEGLCVAASVENACSATEWCNPVLGGGCLPLVANDDAGVVTDAEFDGGPLDAGADAPTIACGTACTPTDEPCAAGFWDCSNAPTCARIGNRAAGTPCAEGSVCDTSGACNVCREGAACHTGCLAGTVSCSDGFEHCVLAALPTTVPEGTNCGESRSCVDGDPCGLGDFCDAEGACVACRDGRACVAGCEYGVVDCSAGGACVGSGDYRALGELCGDDRHCNAAHACVACDEGSACAPTDLCANGITSCDSGDPVCNPVSQRLSAGTTCGTDAVCDNMFTCQHCVAGEACGGDGGCLSGTMLCYFGPYCSLTTYSPAGTTCATGMCSGLGECVTPFSAADVSIGFGHACATRSDGTLRCWGDNMLGELGDGTTDWPGRAKVLVPLSNVVEVSTGYYYTCARQITGTVSCWGSNDYGQLGDGTQTTRGTPADVVLPAPAIDVAAAGYRTCAALNDHSVWCWGVSGYDSMTGEYLMDLSPAQITGLPDIVQVSGAMYSFDHFCGRSVDGEIWCWGENDGAQLGQGWISEFESTPVRVLDIDDAVDVSLASSYACAVRGSGELWCWGRMDETTLLTTPSDFSGIAPQEVVHGITDAVASVRANEGRLCVVTATQSAYCWGQNIYGNLGIAGLSFGDIVTPTAVPGLSNIVDLSVGEGVSSYSGCAVSNDGYVSCWGYNDQSQTGQDSATNPVDGVTLVGDP